MRVIDNGVESSGLIMLLHGASKGLNSEPYQTILKGFKTLDQKAVGLEFSYIQNNGEPDPDQIIESKELEGYLKTQKYKNLTVIGHSNGGFIALVASTRGLKINHLIVLGITVRDSSKQIVAQIIANMEKEGAKVTIIQPEKDDYSLPEQVKGFLAEFNLKASLFTIPGDHRFKGYENDLFQLLNSLLK